MRWKSEQEELPEMMDEGFGNAVLEWLALSCGGPLALSLNPLASGHELRGTTKTTTVSKFDTLLSY